MELAGQLLVSDISVEQLAINKTKMTELGLENRIRDFLFLDITNRNRIDSDQFDVVTCVGGALNYTFDEEQGSIYEMLRATKPGGILIVGAVALFNSLMRYLSEMAKEKQQFGINATKWLMGRGIQDAKHYPVENKNFLHMVGSRDLDTLFEAKTFRSSKNAQPGSFRWPAKMP